MKYLSILFFVFCVLTVSCSDNGIRVVPHACTAVTTDGKILTQHEYYHITDNPEIFANSITVDIADHGTPHTIVTVVHIPIKGITTTVDIKKLQLLRNSEMIADLFKKKMGQLKWEIVPGTTMFSTVPPGGVTVSSPKIKTGTEVRRVFTLEELL